MRRTIRATFAEIKSERVAAFRPASGARICALRCARRVRALALRHATDVCAHALKFISLTSKRSETRTSICGSRVKPIAAVDSAHQRGEKNLWLFTVAVAAL